MYKSSSLITYRKKNEGIEECIPDSSKICRGIPHPVSLHYGRDKPALWDQAVAGYYKNMCTLWLENTVLEVQETYDYFCSKVSSASVGLLHSRYTALDREDNEGIWTSRLGKEVTPEFRANNPCILVGTQVCEQSLDIDADVLYTSACPMDMFLQRIGRTWRHRLFDAVRPASLPEVYFFGWEGHSIADTLDRMDSISSSKDLGLFKFDWRSLCVYDAYVMARTLEVLSTVSHLRIPEDIRKLLEDTYA